MYNYNKLLPKLVSAHHGETREINIFHDYSESSICIVLVAVSQWTNTVSFLH